MKRFVLFFLLIHISGFAQNTDVEFLINENIGKIENALIKNDTLILQELLHSNLTLGHSNGWIETKESLFEDLKNRKVLYLLFEKAGEVVFIIKSDDLVITRRDINAYGVVEEDEFVAELNILEVWTLQDSSWLLTARQSVNRKRLD